MADIINIEQLFKTIEDLDCYISADYHLGKYLRPDKNTKEDRLETEKAIQLHNKVIGKDDMYLFLGDLSEEEFGDELNTDEILSTVKSLIKRLNGKMILLTGNNDSFDNRFYKECGIEIIIRRDKFETNNFIYSHFPVNVTGENKLNIHGHIHGSHKYWGLDWHNHIDCYWKLWNGPKRISELKRLYRIGSYIGETIHVDQNAMADYGCDKAGYDAHK